MYKRRTAMAAAGTALAAVTAGGVLTANSSGSTSPAAASAAASETAPNAVIEWNDVLTGIVHDPALQPKTIHPTHSMAMMNAAIYDAVDAIHGSHPQYLTHLIAVRGASEAAAAATAAHDVLAALYPKDAAALALRLGGSLGPIPETAGKHEGVAVGKAAAAAILALRAGDGSKAAAPPYLPTRTPGRYQPVPPDRKPPVFRQWGRVRTFTLTSADEFRSVPPPPLTSAAYAASYNTVKTLGALHSPARSGNQTSAAAFWNAPIQDFWNAAARETALQRHLGTAATARLFAALDLTLADTAIAFYDTKYAFDLWRPVTAIHAAGTDGNPSTAPDPAWMPLEPTQPDPSYPGAHSAVSVAAAAVLSAFFGSDRADLTLTSTALPGVSRHFPSFSSAAREAALSRIWAGVHTPVDDIAGRQLGRRVATKALLVLHLTPTAG